MSPFGTAAMPLIIIALGLLGIILSFLVPDRKKSLISLALAGVIIVTGLVQLTSQSIQRIRWNMRMKEIQRDRQADLDQLRQKMKTATPPAPAAPVDTKKK